MNNNDTLIDMLDSGRRQFQKGLAKILNQPYYIECSKCGTKTKANKNTKEGKSVCYKCFISEGEEK
jgi:formylmethanofuran dehydrogenase subunit E